MRIWVDLANSPHVPLAGPIAARLRADGHLVLLTARDHAQTVDLARRRWHDVIVIGKESPPGRAGKARALAGRVISLRRYARRLAPHVAFSHGSYAQIVAAWTAQIPAVTMMDYEHQPANHVSFRLARRVLVPDAFPESALRRFGAPPQKARRYPGFKENLYLASFEPEPHVLDELGIDAGRVLAVFRPPPEGALYHPGANERFDEVLREALARDEVEVVLLPRTEAQARRYAAQSPRARIPPHAVDGSSLLALADLVVGAGGTMNRESAVLGTPTYTVFAGELAAVDAALIRQGRLRDLRAPEASVVFEKKNIHAREQLADAESILQTVTTAIAELAVERDFRRRRREAPRPS